MVESIEELRKRCQPRKNKFWVDKIMRKISIYVTKLFLRLGLSANVATCISTLLVVASFIPLMHTQFWQYTVLSGVLLGIGYLFDYADGEVARYRGGTHYGRFLDVASHDIFYIVFLFMGFGLYFRGLGITYVIAAVSATVSVLMVRLHQMRFEYINMSAGSRWRNGRFARYLYRLTLANVFLPPMYLLLLFDLTGYFVLFYGAYYPLFWLGWIIRKRFLDVRDEGKSSEIDLWQEIETHA